MKENIKKIKSMVTDNLPGRQEVNTEDFKQNIFVAPLQTFKEFEEFSKNKKKN